MKKNNKKQQPLVSVIMPAYNASDYIAQSIDSVLNQSYKNWELVIVDDCSTDNTWKIISKYQKKYPKKITVKRLRKNRNSGGDWAANEAYLLTSGEYIARTDADDVMHRDRLVKQVRYMERYRSVDVLGTCAEIIDDKGEIIGEKMQPARHRDIYKQYLINHPMINPSIMFRRSSLLNQKYLYDIKYEHNNDFYSFFAMLTQGKKFANLRQKLMFYRVHGNNDSLKDLKKCFWNTLRIRNKAIFSMGYKVNWKGVVVMLIQVATALLLPEKLIRLLFLVSRGMIKIRIKEMDKRLFSRFKLNLN